MDGSTEAGRRDEGSGVSWEDGGKEGSIELN